MPDGCRGSSQVHALCLVDNTDSSFQPTSTEKGERLTPEDTVPSPRFLLTHILCHLFLFVVFICESKHVLIIDCVVKKFIEKESFFSYISLVLVAHSLGVSLVFLLFVSTQHLGIEVERSADRTLFEACRLCEYLS